MKLAFISARDQVLILDVKRTSHMNDLLPELIISFLMKYLYVMNKVIHGNINKVV